MRQSYYQEDNIYECIYDYINPSFKLANNEYKEYLLDNFGLSNLQSPQIYSPSQIIQYRRKIHVIYRLNLLIENIQDSPNLIDNVLPQRITYFPLSLQQVVPKSCFEEYHPLSLMYQDPPLPKQQYNQGNHYIFSLLLTVRLYLTPQIKKQDQQSIGSKQKKQFSERKINKERSSSKKDKKSYSLSKIRIGSASKDSLNNRSELSFQSNHSKQLSIQTQRSSKGLRTLSLKVKDIVYDLKVTTYKQVAETLINEFLDNKNFYEYPNNKDEQNIKRRVYDALNVMIASGILKKDGKRVSKEEKVKIQNKERRANTEKEIRQLTEYKVTILTKYQIEKTKEQNLTQTGILYVILQKGRRFRKFSCKKLDYDSGALRQTSIPFDCITASKIQDYSSEFKKIIKIESSQPLQIISDIDLIDILGQQFITTKPVGSLDQVDQQQILKLLQHSTNPTQH